MAIMVSNPTCGECLAKCAGAADATSCAMGCASAPGATTSGSSCACCSIDKFQMLMGTGTPGADPMKVLGDISATDPAGGGCLTSVAAAAFSDPAKMLPCATSAASSQLQALIRGGEPSGPTGSEPGGAALNMDTSRACAGNSNIISLKDPSMMSAAKRGCPALPPRHWQPRTRLSPPTRARTPAHTRARTRAHARQPPPACSHTRRA